MPHPASLAQTRISLVALGLLMNSVLFGQPAPTDTPEMAGRYSVSWKSESIPIGNGWEFRHRYDRELILNPDSTYREINCNYSCFEAPSYYGTWEERNNYIILRPDGMLTYEEDGWIPDPDFSWDLYSWENIPSLLDIVSPQALRVREEGRIQGQILYRVNLFDD